MKEIIIAIIGSGALSALVSAIISVVIANKTSNKALQMLLLGEIKIEGRRFLIDGKVDMEDLEAFNETYDIYKKMGGNGYADAIAKKVNDLPVEINGEIWRSK